MANFNGLPPELILHIGDYLAFFDLKALSFTSHRYLKLFPAISTHNLIEYHIHTFQTFLQQHACSSLTKQVGMTQRITLNEQQMHALEDRAGEARVLARFVDLSVHGIDGDYLQKRLTKGTKIVPTPKLEGCPANNASLLQPYFPKPYPESSIAYRYFECTHSFADQVCDAIEHKISMLRDTKHEMHEQVQHLTDLYRTWKVLKYSCNAHIESFRTDILTKTLAKKDPRCHLRWRQHRREGG